jgi:hypothetical protein
MARNETVPQVKNGLWHRASEVKDKNGKETK